MTSLLAACGVTLPARLAPLDLDCPGGKLIALVGPNGGGKTSLLRALAGVEEARGTVAIDGELLAGLSEARRRRLLSFLPASRDIAWPIAVREIIALGLDRSDADQLTRILEQFDLTGLADRPIGSLSTGERARALLARAMAARPRLLLLDEPLANFDPYWVLRTLDLLRAAADSGTCVMVAIHDIALVDRFDRLMLLEGGMLVDQGPPQQLKDRLGTLFGIEAAPGGGWQISPSADPRSLR